MFNLYTESLFGEVKQFFRFICIFQAAAMMLLFTYFSAYAQNKHSTLTIQVLDSAHNPIAGIFVQLNDSTKARWAVSDSSGIVSFNQPNCTYCHLQLRGVGYMSMDTFVQRRSLDTLAFTIRQAIHNLKEVEIRSEQPRISSRNEKIIFSWEQLAQFKKGETIWDLLSMTPLIHTESNNQLKVLNNPNVVVFINGKRQNMPNRELINYLKNLPADRIIQIEIIPIPPANYQVEPGQAVVNVVLKKELQDYLGGNMNISALQNSYFDPSASIHLQGKVGKFSFINSEYLNYTSEKEKFTEDYQEIQTGYRFAQNLTRYRNNWRIMGSSLYLNFDIDSQQSLSSALFLDKMNSHPTREELGKVLYFSNGASEVPDSIGNTYSLPLEDWKDAGYTIDYSLKAFKNKLQLNAEIGQIYYKDHNRQTTRIESLKTGKYDTLYNFVQSVNQRIRNTNFYFKADYTLFKDKTLSLGINGYLTVNDNLVDWENNTPSGYVKDSSLSNTYHYVENNFYPFLNFSGSLFPKISISAGVKYEIARNDGKLNDAYIFKRNQNTWIPTLILDYQINSNNQITYSFTSSKVWPSFWELNPIRMYSSANDYVEENPYLKSAKQDEHMLRYSFHQKHQFIFDYKITHDDYSQYVFFRPGHIINITRVNFDYTRSISFLYANSLAAMHQHIVLNPQLGVVYNQIKGNDSIYADYHKLSAMVQLSAQIVLSEAKNWNCIVNGVYFSPSLSGIYDAKSFGSLGVEMKKSVKKWDLGLLVQDPFKLGTQSARVLTNRPVNMYVRTYYDNFYIRLRAVFHFWQNMSITEKSMENQSILQRLGH